MASPSENRRALGSHPCVALSSRYPGKATTGYPIFHGWTIVENSIVLDKGSTLFVIPKNAKSVIIVLISKKNMTNRHNISPVEVKSSRNYTLSSLRKFITRYHEQLHVPYVLHPGDLKTEEGIVFLPLYMTSLI